MCGVCHALRYRNYFDLVGGWKMDTICSRVFTIIRHPRHTRRRTVTGFPPKTCTSSVFVCHNLPAHFGHVTLCRLPFRLPPPVDPLPA